MKYAKSILLSGELIDAQSATYSDYKNLIMVCPVCNSEVFLCREFLRKSKKGKTHAVLSTWKHYSGEGIFGVTECEVRSQYSPTVAHQQNAVARQQRLGFYRKRLWSLIKRSPLIDQNHIADHIDYIFNDGVLSWFISVNYKMLKSQHSSEILTTGFSLVRKEILNFSPSETGEKTTYSALAELFQQNNNLEFIEKIADEALEFCVKNWGLNELKKLIAVTISKELGNTIYKWTESLLSSLVKQLPREHKKTFVSAWEKNQEQGMLLVEKIVRTNPKFNEAFTVSLGELLNFATMNLISLFVSLPWIDELKKHSTEVKLKKL